MALNRKQDTKGKILEAALKVFADKGYHSASVEDIVSASNTSKGGFYFHFPSKQELFLALLEEMGGILVEKIKEATLKGNDSKAKAKLALEKGLHIFFKYKRLAKFLLIEAFVSGKDFEKKRREIYQSLEEIIKSVLDEAKKNGEIEESIDTEMVSTLWIGAINQLVIKSLTSQERLDLTRETEKIGRYLFQMVGWVKNDNAAKI